MLYRVEPLPALYPSALSESCRTLVRLYDCLIFEDRIILDRAIFSLSMFDVQKGWRGKRRLGECVDGEGGGPEEETSFALSSCAGLNPIIATPVALLRSMDDKKQPRCNSHARSVEVAVNRQGRLGKKQHRFPVLDTTALPNPPTWVSHTYIKPYPSLSGLPFVLSCLAPPRVMLVVCESKRIPPPPPQKKTNPKTMPPVHNLCPCEVHVGTAGK